MWIDVVVIIILCLSFLGGAKEGAVKHLFSVLTILIAIYLTGRSYGLIAGLLAFLPGTNWEKFIGFFITMALISVILHFIFFIPRRIVQKVWNKGVLFRILGAVLNVFNAGIGLTVLTLVLTTYPIMDFLARWVATARATIA